MRWSLAAMVVVLFASVTFAGEPKTRAINVWDTLKPAPAQLPLTKNDWKPIAVDQTQDSFKGDAVVSNGRIAAAFRKHGGVEVYAVTLNVAVPRVRLRVQTADGESADALDAIALTENGKGAASISATYKTAKGTKAVAKFRIKKGDVAVQVEPGEGAAKLRVGSPSRFVVLPDFWADDMTLDATKLPLAAVDLPSENFVLQPIAGGNAIVLTVFENRKTDVKVTLDGKGPKREVTAADIEFEKKRIWVAILDTPQIWHMRDIAETETDKVVKLDWRMPYPAQWRVDFTRSNGLIDSWEMLLQEKGYITYTRHTWLGAGKEGPETFAANRERWNTVLGTYSYPAWSDTDGRGYVQPIKDKMLKFVGPALIYPIHRVPDTPTDAFTVVDVMRNTLGVGPCEHILKVQAHEEQYIGQATCGVRDILNPIYANKQQKKKRDEINKTLDDGLIFVKHIRGRINDYVDFGTKLRSYLAEKKKTLPELAEFIDEMDKLTREIDLKVAARKPKISSPDNVAKMMADFRKNVLDFDDDGAEGRCNAFTKALQIIGDNQDELSGELRWVVKTLRQRAGIRVALDPRVAPIASEIRSRTQEVLRNPAWHEAPRH